MSDQHRKERAEGGSTASSNMWRFGFDFPASMLASWSAGARRRAQRCAPVPHVQVWLPAGAVRALLLIPNNTDLVEIGCCAAMRTVAEAHGIGVIYLRAWDADLFESEAEPTAARPMLAWMLTEAARLADCPAVVHVPWLTIGKSSRARFAFALAWAYPGRVIASVVYHGETPTWPTPAWAGAAVDQVWHLNVNGLTEWDGTWYRHVRPSLLNHHHHTAWLTHQVVLAGIAHGRYADDSRAPGWQQPVADGLVSCQSVWAYIATFYAAAMQARVPAGASSVAGPVSLSAIDPQTGWLIHQRAIEELLGLKWMALRGGGAHPYATVPWPDEATPVFDQQQGAVPVAELIQPAERMPLAERADWWWLPTHGLVAAWLQLHNQHGLADRVLAGLPEC